MNNMFQNTGYRNEREHKKTLILDVGNSEGLDPASSPPINTFTCNLEDTFLIDEISDIYIDSFTTHGAVRNYSAGDGRNMGFLLSLNEINIKTNSTGDKSFLRIFIPNTASTGGATSSSQHKGKNMNFIATINPCILSKISGSFTFMDGSSTALTNTNSRFIAELVFVKRRDVSKS